MFDTAIVPQEIFDKVQARMEKNKHKPAASKADEEYILTTKLFCGKCGAMMVGVGGTSKTGKVHYYKCGNLIYKKSCDKKTVQKGWIERVVVALTHDSVLRDEIIDRLADAVVELQKRENTTLLFLQKQLDEIDKKIANIVKSVEDGLANATLKSRLDELEAAKVNLEISIAKEKIEKTPLTKEQVVFWISNFKGGDIENSDYRRSLVDIFVNSIFLYEDKIVLTFNWKDGTKTVSLAELEHADTGGEDEVIAANVLNINDFRGSHLVRSSPPISTDIAIDAPARARVSSVMCSIIKTTKENGLHPYRSPEVLLTVLPCTTTPDPELPPWSKTMLGYCRATQQKEV
jgi:hypothetical protein